MRTSADIRRVNSFAVVRALHASGGASRRELAESTDLSFATVAAICTELIEMGVLVEVAREKAAAGRPTARLSLNPDHGYLLGIDIAETYVHVSALDAALEPISSTRRELDVHQRKPRDVVRHVREAIAEEASKHERPLLGVGASVPGLVDQVGGASVFAPNWGWHNVPLRDMLGDVTSAPLYLDNPLKSLVIGELWSRPERRLQDFAVVNLGTGVGAGFAIEGRVHRGRTNSAGEWGHTVIVADGRACRCGSRGCVEAYVGVPGVIQTLREIGPESPILHGDDQTATMIALRAAADAGDPIALATIERSAHYLGIAVASLINFLNPEVVSFGGWVSAVLGERLVESLEPHVRAHALAVPMFATRLELREQNLNSVSLGAAALALEGYLDSITGSAFTSQTATSKALA